MKKARLSARRSEKGATKPLVAIFTAMQEVEKMPADTRLTEAVILLAKAKDCVADFIDGGIKI